MLDYADRPIKLPIEWTAGAPGDGEGDGGSRGDGGDGDGGGGGGGRNDGDGGDDKNYEDGGDDDEMGVNFSQTVVPGQFILCPQQTSSITFRDPISNPAELEAVIRSSRQQPNWKAAQIEGQSWEGTAEANIKKFQRIMHPPPEDLC